MGSLFSSPTPGIRIGVTDPGSVRGVRNDDRSRRNYNNFQQVVQVQTYHPTISRRAPVVQPTRPINVIRNTPLRRTCPIKSVKNTLILNLRDDPFYDPSQVVSYIPLDEYDPYYFKIRNKINKNKFVLDYVERIENPYLKKAYELKKEQKMKIYPDLEEHELFHGTKRANVTSICEGNFNWRYCKTHRFGQGVSFSPNFTYSSNYSDENDNRVMILAKVLIGKRCLGHKAMLLPLPGCDTSVKNSSGIVIVKYEDSEFYPAYIIYYHLRNVQNNVTFNYGHPFF